MSYDEPAVCATVLAGRYRLLRRIGLGSMGIVWEGEDVRLVRRVAVKVLRPDYVADPDFVARFQNEARATAALAHLGIVKVFDVGVDGDTRFIVM